MVDKVPVNAKEETVKPNSLRITIISTVVQHHNKINFLPHYKALSWCAEGGGGWHWGEGSCKDYKQAHDASTDLEALLCDGPCGFVCEDNVLGERGYYG